MIQIILRITQTQAVSKHPEGGRHQNLHSNEGVNAYKSTSGFLLLSFEQSASKFLLWIATILLRTMGYTRTRGCCKIQHICQRDAIQSIRLFGD